jgi:hypothetical protein
VCFGRRAAPPSFVPGSLHVSLVHEIMRDY